MNVAKSLQEIQILESTWKKNHDAKKTFECDICVFARMEISTKRNQENATTRLVLSMILAVYLSMMILKM